jgi:hypothetical protein
MSIENDRGDEFELRLRRGGRLVPEFEADVDGPDPATDRLVLARARAAIAAPERSASAGRFDRSPRWAVPLALAATLVLSFVLVLQMESRDVTAPPAGEVAADAASDAAAPAPAAATGAKAGDDAAAAMAESASAGAPVATAREATRVAPDAAPAAPPPAPAALPQPTAVLQAPAATQRAAAAVSAAAELRYEAAADEETPQAWLARIERLQAAGDIETARRELAAFRERHPQWALPEGLRALTDR